MIPDVERYVHAARVVKVACLASVAYLSFYIMQTTVVQLLSVILQIKLTVVNCHASTETSDLLGGFRPIRGRQDIAQEMSQKTKELIDNWLDSSFELPEYNSETMTSPKLTVEFMRGLSRLYLRDLPNSGKPEQDKMSNKKRRKLANGKADGTPPSQQADPLQIQLVATALREVESLFQKYSSLFEWVDGPLVRSMKDGSMLLLDEMSLAEDAVLERLNSVLEPSRTLVLAEKGGEGPSCVHESESFSQVISSEVIANDKFRIFATMNPGGDFGKRELSPALRSRFTEIWVPPVTHRTDVDLVLERSFSASVEREMILDEVLEGAVRVRTMMLDYVDWFNVAICDDPSSFCNDFKLSLRDVLSWARFVADVSFKHKSVDLFAAYVHGASLMHLDGLGLGTGVSNHDALITRNKAKAFLMSQFSEEDSASVIGFQDEVTGINDLLVVKEDSFGINPFTISTGSEEVPADLNFHLTAPTTGMNLRRVLRGMQISKPILLEGSPGVGKTR